MSSNLSSLRRASNLKYRLFILVFGLVMAGGTYYTDYVAASVFFVLVAIGGAILIWSRWD